MQVLFNHKDIDGGDFGVLYGFSLFETFYVNEKGGIFLLDRHLERLYSSMAFFGMGMESGRHEFKERIHKYVKDNGARDKIMRVTVTCGNPAKSISPSVMFSLRENPYGSIAFEKGSGLTFVGFAKNETSPLAAHKTANYMENLLAGRAAAQKGFDDAVFLNSKNHVAETTKSNIFFVSKGVLHTPGASCGLLPGIIRGWVLEKAEELGIQCEQGCYSREKLFEAEEVFVTNSAMGVMPVASIDGVAAGRGPAGEIIRLLAKEYQTISGKGRIG